VPGLEEELLVARAQEAGSTTPFSPEADTAPEFYLTGNPGPDTPTVRTGPARRAE